MFLHTEVEDKKGDFSTPKMNMPIISAYNEFFIISRIAEKLIVYYKTLFSSFMHPFNYIIYA